MSNQISWILDECYEAVDSGQRSVEDCLDSFPEFREELEPLLRTAIHLKNIPTPQPRETFINYAKLRLIQKISSATALQKRGVRLGRITLPPRAFVLMGVILLILASTFSVQGSQSALPGDLIYPLKLGVEELRLALANEEEDIRLDFEFAQNRLEEIQALHNKGKFSALDKLEQKYHSGLDRATNDLLLLDEEKPGEHKKLIDEVDQNLAQNIIVLEDLLNKVPESAREGILNAIAASSKNQDRLESKGNSLGRSNTNSPSNQNLNNSLGEDKTDQSKDPDGTKPSTQSEELKGGNTPPAANPQIPTPKPTNPMKENNQGKGPNK